MLIEIKNITKKFRSNDGDVKTVFANFSYSIHQSEFITIVGPNGSGKSTLLNLIAGIERPDAGEVVVKNGITKPSIGYVWQDYRSSLLPWKNVYGNIEFPLKLHKIDKSERRKIVNSLLDEFQISFSPKKKVYKLSGGQQQLVCLLRSIASMPDLILCDEPFSALDQASRWTMAFYLEQLWLRKPVPVLFVSHDIDESILLGSKIILLNSKGEIEEILQNNLSRPRNIEMLSAPEHIEHRKRVIEFMKENGAIKDRTNKSTSHANDN